MSVLQFDGKTRRLKSLVVTEGSSVDRGAGEGTRVVFMKKETPMHNDTLLVIAKNIAERGAPPVFAKRDFYDEIVKRADSARRKARPRLRLSPGTPPTRQTAARCSPPTGRPTAPTIAPR